MRSLRVAFLEVQEVDMLVRLFEERERMRSAADAQEPLQPQNAAGVRVFQAQR